jgi:hypothetical protein
VNDDDDDDDDDDNDAAVWIFELVVPAFPPLCPSFLSASSSLTLLVPLLPLSSLFLGLSAIRTRTAWRYVYWDYVRH